MNFGNVLLIFLASTSLFGCARYHDNGGELYHHYEQYENKVAYCLQSTSDGATQFPKSEWLSSLDQHEQKTILIYLSNMAMNNCIEKEKESLKFRLTKENSDVQKIISKWLELDKEKVEKPSGVDEYQLENLESQITTPFNTFQVFELIKK